MKLKRIRYVFLALTTFCLAFSSTNEKITVHSIGDSTMANYLQSDNLMRGWMQVMGENFKEGVTINNKAVSGASSKSFRDRGYWDKVINEVKKGDYVFIQFGHNDEKKDIDRATVPETTFKQNLTNYVNEVRAKEAYPILFTSIVRRRFDNCANVVDTHGDYIKVVRTLATELNVPLVDLNKETEELVKRYGVEDSKKLFMFIAPGATPRYPTGLEDNTHLCELGAKEIAGLTAIGLKTLNSPLANYLK